MISLSLQQYYKQSHQNKLKQPFTKFQYDHPHDWSYLNIAENNKQIFSRNRQFLGLAPFEIGS